ncbi:MAG: glycosyltransferase family 39 protein [Anaerolineae bacterium]|nr:glycosyltransferase family 39 protein [Anaerolineae bacterium]
MIALLRHLFDARYLYAQQADPLGAWPRGTALATLGLLLGLLLAWLWGRRLAMQNRPAGTATATLTCLGLALAAMLARPWLSGPFSARIWYLSAVALALAIPALSLLGRAAERVGLGHVGTVLGLAWPEPGEEPLAWPCSIMGLAVHAAGLHALRAELGPLIWPLALALICLVLSGLARGIWRRPGSLLGHAMLLGAPLLLPYMALLLRLALGAGLGVDVEAYAAFPYPDPLSLWLDVRSMLWAGLIWMALMTVAALHGMLRERSRRDLLLWPFGILLLIGAAWYIASVSSHLSHGVTGSDPYCYLQMAADLVAHKTALHRFPLAQSLSEIGLPVWPAVHVGYHPPGDGLWAATVWPIGWPMLLVPFLALGGEAMALWAAPLCTLASAGLIVLWTRDTWPDSSSGRAWLAGALAAVILLTSRESLLRALVPMADAAAQLFSALTLFCLWRAWRRDRLRWSAAAGLALGMAYLVRHPQLLLAPAALVLIGRRAWPPRRRLVHLMAFGVAALLCALPDLSYHTRVFGAPWRTESPEWFLISWRNLGPTWRALVRDGWLRRAEFGYLWPFVVAGLWHQWRAPATRPAAAMLLIALLPVVGFSLAYSALRLRDLIPIFPWFALWAAQGVLNLWEATRTWLGGSAARVLLLLALVVALSARGAQTWSLPWDPAVWTFGHVTADQRAAYEQLASELLPDAVVATSLNSGAVERYTGRQTVRPRSWTREELGRFRAWLAQEGRPWYVLDDGEEMGLWIGGLGGELDLSRVDQFEIPTFGLGGQAWGQPAVLYRVEP